ncbi:hypothetical protein D3874_12620 [Oleomonas cavernae]|uniref:Uncharacterized protein n=1 Tax=Oleomonas cavernae TaxID=2320859 RepID=A0A418WCJ9_9PROT|nr:hypothetical protein [Oleomonas cavernae]RJF87763.1 hypothetical protein D3874_12620 [Oleomonas cavernae]
MLPMPEGTEEVTRAYRWMWLAIVTLGLGALVAWRQARQFDQDDPFTAAHRRHISRSVGQCAAVFGLGILLSATAVGIFVQAAAIIWYLHRYATGSVLAEDRLAP